METLLADRKTWRHSQSIACLLAGSIVALSPSTGLGQTAPISVSPDVPPDIKGGAPNATPEQAADFAWQEFIALNWPAGPQEGKLNQREAAFKTEKFGDSKYVGPLVWQTFRGKVEIFPGNYVNFPVPAPPPGFAGSSADTSFGYDALPVYNYGIPISACDPNQASDPTPWVNLDETDQITLDNMYAGTVEPNVSRGNSSPQLIRFMAKANRSEYVYVAGNSTPSDPTKLWWHSIPSDVVAATKAYLAAHMSSPPSDSKDMVSQKDGTIEIKAGWRPLNPSEAASGRFHIQTVRFYETASGGKSTCFIDSTGTAPWGLVALHIIQKTKSAPYFIYATFEQADNILTADGTPVEDAEGNLIPPSPANATTPKVCLVDPQPPKTAPPANGIEATSALGSVILTDDPATCQGAPSPSYCGSPGSRLYYRNDAGDPPNSAPSKGNICVDKRDNAIPDYVIDANVRAHAVIAAYLKQSNIPLSPWLSYKLVNVQYYPYDKVPVPGAPNGSLYTAQPPYTATNPAPSSYYQANIVVETNRSLQFFSGGLSPNISTDWNQDGTAHKNTIYGGHSYNMGGCMGCHGSQGQNPLIPYSAGDFSVILARGAVGLPEVPKLLTSQGMTSEPRNVSLSK